MVRRAVWVCAICNTSNSSVQRSQRVSVLFRGDGILCRSTWRIGYVLTQRDLYSRAEGHRKHWRTAGEGHSHETVRKRGGLRLEHYREQLQE